MCKIELEPVSVFDCFSRINAIPRPSKKEGQIRAWLVNFAKEHNDWVDWKEILETRLFDLADFRLALDAKRSAYLQEQFFAK